jgi:hypothetical protein
MSAKTVTRLLLALRNDTLDEAAAIVRDIGGKVLQAPDVDPDKLKTLADMLEGIAKAIESLRVRS